MNNPLLSIFMSSRIFNDAEDPTIPNIFNFFNSATKSINPENRDKIEFLIRFDNDDAVAKDLIIKKQKLAKYPFVIKYFFYDPWEGLLTNHFSYTSLLLRKNKNSKFIALANDDAIFTTESNKLFNRLEIEYNNNYYWLALDSRVPTNKVAGYPIIELERNKDYRKTQTYNLIAEPYPVISSKIFEICSLFGWHRNIDTWLSLINQILYSKYKINLIKALGFIWLIRINLRAEQIKYPLNVRSTYNHDLMGDIIPVDHYYFDICEQQAKNIYLNIKEDGLLQKYVYTQRK